MSWTWRTIAVGWFVVLVFACSPRSSRVYDPFQIDKDQFYSRVKTISLAPLRIPEEIEDEIAKRNHFQFLIENEIKKIGFSVVPTKVYEKIWDAQLKEAGGYFDPRTGEADEEKYKVILEKTRKEIHSSYQADAFLYSGFQVVQPTYYGRAQAFWDGATEEVWTKEKGRKLKGRVLSALSLVVFVQGVEGNRLFANAGGIQLLTKLSKSGFLNMDIVVVEVSEDEILTDARRNEAAVEFALRPLKGRSISFEDRK